MGTSPVGSPVSGQQQGGVRRRGRPPGTLLVAEGPGAGEQAERAGGRPAVAAPPWDAAGGADRGRGDRLEGRDVLHLREMALRKDQGGSGGGAVPRGSPPGA